MPAPAKVAAPRAATAPPRAAPAVERKPEPAAPAPAKVAAPRAATAPPRAAPAVERKPTPAAPAEGSGPTLPQPAASSATFSLEMVQDQWNRILQVLKTHNLPTQALMRSCKPAGVEGNTLVLNWPSEMLRSKYEDARTKRLVEDVISEAVGVHVVTRCVVAAKAKPDDDPLVQEAIKLGGRVVNA